MTFKRALVFTLVGLFVLAVPAAAFAAVWKDNGVNVTKLISIGLTGTEIVEFGGDSIACQTHATIQTEGGSTAKMTNFEIKKCIGSGTLSKCELASFETKHLPWPIKVNTADLTLENFYLKHVFKNCALVEVVDMPAFTTLTLLSPSAISELEWATGGLKGFYIVDAPNSGTYGIG